MSVFKAKEIGVSFGGVRALHDVSFSVEKGEIFSIMGPNGAGKTTVFNLISRFYDLDHGDLYLNDERISKIAPHEVAARGIARTFQNTELFENETVLQNLLTAHHTHRGTSFLSEMFYLPWVRRQELSFRKKVEDIIDLLNLQSYRDQRIDALPFGARKIVELGRALSLEPELLLLDEPSSGLNPEETEDLSFWIEDINEELGVTVIMVEHDMNLIGQVSGRAMALNDGELLTIGTPEEVREHPDVINAYLGE
ncbi:MAG: ATP-binding cassette domain-containing protein [Gammaproteobacteria bacterium]|nr:ATP-binding cassette domain-containing protein [Gammaproteobacteria bacterium]